MPGREISHTEGDPRPGKPKSGAGEGRYRRGGLAPPEAGKGGV